MKVDVYVLTQTSIGTGDIKILGVFRLDEGIKQKTIRESIYGNLNYNLAGPFNFNISDQIGLIDPNIPFDLPNVPLIFPDVPTTPLIVRRNNGDYNLGLNT